MMYYTLHLDYYRRYDIGKHSSVAGYGTSMAMDMGIDVVISCSVSALYCLKLYCISHVRMLTSKSQKIY